MLTTLAEKVDPNHAAIVVVDMQNDFCHPEGGCARLGADVSQMAKAAEPLRRLIAAARAVGMNVIFIQNEQTEWTKSEVFREKRRGRSIEICEAGSWGADFFGVEPGPEDYVVKKHRYSAFGDTDLDLILRSRKIKSLLMAGVQTNVCVESTARDAYMKNYYVVLIEDCCGTTSPEEHQATLVNIGKYFGTVTNTGEVIGEWSKLGTAAATAAS